jgi:hypothetical protein
MLLVIICPNSSLVAVRDFCRLICTTLISLSVNFVIRRVYSFLKTMLIDRTDVLRCVMIGFLYSASRAICTFMRPLVLSVLVVAALVVRAGAESALPWGVTEFCDVPKSQALEASRDKQEIPNIVRPPSRLDSLRCYEVGSRRWV